MLLYCNIDTYISVYLFINPSIYWSSICLSSLHALTELVQTQSTWVKRDKATKQPEFNQNTPTLFGLKGKQAIKTPLRQLRHLTVTFLVSDVTDLSRFSLTFSTWNNYQSSVNKHCICQMLRHTNTGGVSVLYITHFGRKGQRGIAAGGTEKEQVRIEMEGGEASDPRCCVLSQAGGRVLLLGRVES